MITFYTSHCPKCKVLKNELDKKGIKYSEEDNPTIYMEVAEKHHITSMPFAQIDGKVVDTKELMKYINKGE